VREDSRLLKGVGAGEFVYFTHSYKAPVTADTAAVTQYIEPFASAVERGNVMGVQFHPEKSGETGLKILRSFLGWNAEGTK
jgi:glutamine amidotransferase